MSPVLSAAIRAHIKKYGLGDAEAAAPTCCETVSTRLKKGLFGGKTEVILTGVLLSPHWLVWASGKEGETPAVLSARLRDIRAQDYETTDMYRLVADSGLTISGPLTDAIDPVSAFIGLGPEPAAREFRTALKEALAQWTY